ncbi:ATP-binding cassette domain-containing protein [Nocardia macrotermitis]|uniref:Putative ABC transporter ATP-binding protein n=1 Tax=Nocardia macrotermitis TaxID=2585198 RepID=A0A7K0D123_9NOCA|nr:ATP-binding cassette domain-containing protein [Nocardia macrotermitis]MQY19371.1 putative ABC transporter ATP-binding protein [Nocardia macrotermitis]
MTNAWADFRRMRKMLGLSGRRVAVSIGWGVLALGSGLALSGLAAWLIARAWEMPPVLDLSVAVVAVRALGISRGLCRYLERLATHDVALRAMTTARTGVYTALARADIWTPRSRSAAEPAGAQDDPTRLRRGDLLTRIVSDIDDLGTVVVRAVVPIAVATILSVAAVAVLATVSLPAAAILALALAVAGIFAPWLSARAAREAELAVRDDRTEFTAAAMTVLDHAPELRVAGRLDAALETAASASRRAVTAEDRAAAHSAWAAAATPVSIGVSVLGALLIGIALYGAPGIAGMPEGTLQSVPPGALTPMAMAVLVLLPLSAFEAVGVLPAAAQALTRGRAALHRITAAEHTKDLRAQPDRLRQLPELPAGRRIAVLGPSGAGKTTLLMAWAGLFDTPRPGITFFAEDAHLFGTTVLENLRVSRGDITEAQAIAALRAVGAGDWLDSLPEGLYTDLIGGAAAVSGGQRRRLLLARALLSPADVLLLDEPTEHLEADTGATLLRALLDATSGLIAPDRTVVVVTHQLPPNHHADTVIHLSSTGHITTETRPTSNFAPRENTLPTPATTR